ncbi:MAG: DNA polymerase/3'-5' exonuclease PolX [Lewinellaceae bacterium]|nr:DNA polymerase/3'-5' exonuclease PolX [Lewinellaceae bacterium]
MTNKAIAQAFQELANLMELHQENPFKIRSYQNAYITLRKLTEPLSEMSVEDISAIKGVGAAISGKIQELVQFGKMETLEKYRAKTPEGIQEMLMVKGFGPKKVQVVWQDLGVESIGELLYAINENRLLELKGFGAKTQEELRRQLSYFQRTKHQFHYGALIGTAEALVRDLQEALPETLVSLTGAIRRCDNVLDGIDILIGQETLPAGNAQWDTLQLTLAGEGTWKGSTADEIPVTVHLCAPEQWGSRLFTTTGSPSFLQAFTQEFSIPTVAVEDEIFRLAGLPAIAPEMREDDWSVALAKAHNLPALLVEKDIRGVVHAHSTYSDGIHTVAEMAAYSRAQGFDYLVMTDHSQAAFYANGLSVERVLAQHAEIDQLNRELAPFRIFKGIESDILSDGSLDYEEEILQQFEVIIASVHSGLKMDREKATQRIVRAVENPYTHILGHPTGRLLLSREGYPLDHRRIIDACAANGVAIELNASPYRLDLDWSWIPYALEKEVWISINPDAHSREGIHDIRFGVCSARKGGLPAASCLNALDAAAFATLIQRKRQ